MDYQFLHIKSSNLDLVQLDEVMNIYISSFPLEEQLNFEELYRSIKSGQRDLFVVLSASKVLGIAVAKPLSCFFVLLEYLAIKSDQRNLGIGHDFLSYLYNFYLGRRSLGIVLEVEKPGNLTCDDEINKVRRISFYKRNYYSIVDCAPNYCMPNLISEGTIPLWLMWRPILITDKCLTNSLLRTVITTIYSETYLRFQEDPILKSILNGLIC
jgi:hypothetical protein